MAKFLIDTNILIYATDRKNKFYKKAKKVIGDVLEGSIKGCIAYQNLYEFIAVVTDPKRVNRPLTLKRAVAVVKKYREATNIKKVYPLETNLDNFLKLISDYKVSKQDIFDLVLIATMRDNEINGIYTTEDKTFKKFNFLQVINPCT